MDAYAYKGSLYCESCAKQIRQGLNATFWPVCMKEDSNYYPQGPYSGGGGDADTPQHCDACHAFLENPLTVDGVAYVQDAVDNYRDDNRATLATWRAFYGINRTPVGPTPADILRDVKRAIREPYAWPGGYPLYVVMHDGESLSCAAARENWRLIASATIRGVDDRWRAAGVDTNWEDASLYCAHSGERIPSAYGEDDANQSKES